MGEVTAAAAAVAPAAAENHSRHSSCRGESHAGGRIDEPGPATAQPRQNRRKDYRRPASESLLPLLNVETSESCSAALDLFSSLSADPDRMKLQLFNQS